MTCFIPACQPQPPFAVCIDMAVQGDAPLQPFGMALPVFLAGQPVYGAGQQIAAAHFQGKLLLIRKRTDGRADFIDTFPSVRRDDFDHIAGSQRLVQYGVDDVVPIRRGYADAPALIAAALLGKGAASYRPGEEIVLIRAVKAFRCQLHCIGHGVPSLLRRAAMAVHDAAVGLYDGTDIAQSFHAAFDFKGRNAGIHECIDIFEAVQILQTQDIGVLLQQGTAVFRQVIRQAARLGAGAAVAAAAADKAAHEALSRVRHTRCAVNKHFNSHRRMTADFPDFIEGYFPGQDGLRKAEPFQKAHAVQIGDGHLRTAVQGQIGRDLAGYGGNGQILHDDAVYADGIQIFQIARQSLQLLISHDDVDGHIYPYAEYVGNAHGFG